MGWDVGWEKKKGGKMKWGGGGVGRIVIEITRYS